MAAETKHHHDSGMQGKGSQRARSTAVPIPALLVLLAAVTAAAVLVAARTALAAETLTIYVRKAWTTSTGVEVAAPKGTMPVELELTRYTGDDPSSALATGTTIELDETCDWKGSIVGLAAQDEQGQPYHYSFREIDPPVPYELRSITGSGTSEEDPLVVTNAPAATSLSLTKVWKDDSDARKLRPDEVVLVLENDKGLDTQGLTPNWDKEGDTWQASFAGLPKYADDGSLVSWRVREETLDGYMTSYSSGDHVLDGGTITNELIVPEEPEPENPEPESPSTPDAQSSPEPTPEPEEAAPEASVPSAQAEATKQASAAQERLPQTDDESNPSGAIALALVATCLAAAGVVLRLRS